MTEQNLSARMWQGAELLGKIKVKAFAAKPTDVPSAVFSVIEEEKYPFLPPQLGVLPHAILLIMKYRTAVEELRLLQGVNPETASAVIADKLGCNSEDIRQIIIHDVSATAILSNSSFLTVCENICRKEQVDVSHAKSIAGMASKDFYVKIGDNTLPVSIQDEHDKRDSTAKHEDLHVQYTVFHQYYNPQDKSSSDVDPLTQLTETAVNEARDNNLDAFKKTVESVTYNYLYLYLNELSSSALTKSPAYQRFFNEDEYYYARFSKQINALRLGLPNDEKRMPFERIIYEEVQKIKHKMKYIEDRYLKLCNDRVPPATNDQLVSMIQILKPELGFTINAFLNNRPYTPEEEAEWQEEYENGWKPKNRGERVNDWAEFFVGLANIQEKEYAPIRIDVRTRILKYKEELYRRLMNSQERKIDLPLDIEPFIWLMQDIPARRIQRVQKYFVSEYFQQLEIPEEEKKEIKKAVFSKAVDFHEIFLGIISSFHFELNAVYTSEQALYITNNPNREQVFDHTIERQLQRLAKRSLSLDDAAEDLVETVMAGRKPKWHTLFTPGYKKSNERRQRAFEDITHKGISDTRFISPLEYVSIAILKTMCYQGMIPARMGGKNLSIGDCNQKVASLLYRLQRWARDQDGNSEQLAIIKKFMERFNLPEDYIMFLKSNEAF